MLVLLPKEEFNCKIYRHGVYKDTLLQIDPHMKKPDCDQLARDGLIYGCGKPFKIIKIAYNNYKISKCEYI
tara:strand:+ start:373 stop:585 length:213 start_codon:yes stop_codon:yes gene_type:complete